MFHGHMLLEILKAKKVFEHFTKKNYKKTKQNKFRIEKVMKKGINYMSNEKVMKIHLIVELIKKTI